MNGKNESETIYQKFSNTYPMIVFFIIHRQEVALHPNTPIHIKAEFKKFKSRINDTQFRKKVGKEQKFTSILTEKLAVYWNSEVYKQERMQTNLNKQPYYKLLPQLERHHKRTLAWSSERSTVLMGSNAEAFP